MGAEPRDWAQSRPDESPGLASRIGWRHQQRSRDGVIAPLPFERGPPCDRQASQAVGAQHHRRGKLADGVAEIGDPDVAARPAPHSQLRSDDPRILGFPQALPVAGPRIVDTGHHQDGRFGGVVMAQGHRLVSEVMVTTPSDSPATQEFCSAGEVQVARQVTALAIERLRDAACRPRRSVPCPQSRRSLDPHCTIS